MQDLSWDDLRIFLALVRASSLQAAADALGVHHSTVWRRLKQLQDATGSPLFERTPDGYALTDLGEAVLPHAERVEEEVFAIQRRVAATDAVPGGTVRVTAPESLLPLLGPALVSFRDAWPGVQVDLELGDRFFDLDRREADVAIRPGPTPPDSAVGRRVCGVAWTRYGPRGHDGAAESLPWIGYGEALARLSAVTWARAQRDAPPALTVSTVPAMAALLAQGGHQGMLPCFIGDRTPALERLRPPVPEAGSALWLLVHADLRRAARVRRFVDHTWDALRALGPVFEGTAEHR